jgi:hypothetical protein
MIKYAGGKTYGEVVDDLIAIKDKDEARRYFEDIVQEAMATGLERDKAIERVRGNLGYLMGYAPTKIDCALWESVGAKHPIFGSMADGVQMTDEEIIKKGQEMGSAARKGDGHVQ